MPLSLSSSSRLGFGAGTDFPPTLKFPANTVIPYYGASTDPGLYDWTRYTAADGYYLWSAATQAEIGTTYQANAGGASISGSTGSAGAHAGSAVTQSWRSATGGSTAQSSSGGPTHTHTYSGSGYSSTDTMLNKQNITLLRSTKSTRYLPVNSLVVKQTAMPDSTAFTRTGNNYLCGANDITTFVAGTGHSYGISIGVSYDSGHYHASSSSAYQTLASGAYYRNYSMGYAGAHSHTASAAFSQSTIVSKLVNLWQLTKSAVPTTDMIVMYVGTLASLPETWKLCDGLNGTTNLGGYIIGYSDNQWNVTTTANPSGALNYFSSEYVSHSHAFSYSPSANVAGPTAYHSNYGWVHTHTTGSGVSTYAYLPQRIGMAFIQYKG